MGAAGYPGNLAVSVTYEITADNELCISYSAQTDKATPINLTNHAYWNLSGDLNRPIYGHDIRMPSQFYLPVDNTQIPTGELTPVEGTPFDLTQGVTITADLLKSAGDWTPDGDPLPPRALLHALCCWYVRAAGWQGSITAMW